jgi:precorrin-2 methylase
MAAVFAVVLGTTLTAYAHVNPVDVAERCVNHIDNVSDRAHNAVADDTQECVTEIRRLLRAGREEAAHAVARRCAQDARETVRIASEEIEATCAECIRYLTDVGANPLARRVYNYCEEVLADFDTLLDRQQQILADALNG